MEKTRQYLGGDATHSILVKGLDYSLLAQRKAELEREREIDRDEELDAMMGDIGSKAGPSVEAKSKPKQKGPVVEKLGKGVRCISEDDNLVQIWAKADIHSVQIDRESERRSCGRWRREEEEKEEKGGKARRTSRGDRSKAGISWKAVRARVKTDVGTETRGRTCQSQRPNQEGSSALTAA